MADDPRPSGSQQRPAAPGPAAAPPEGDPAREGGGRRRAARIALLGVHGHGRSHLQNIVRLHLRGAADLTALVDPSPFTGADAADVASAVAALELAGDALAEPPDGAPGRAGGVIGDLLASTPQHTDLDALLRVDAPDVVVICTPIHTHHDLAAQALRAGCDVLLEKPPTASMDEHRSLLALQRQTGGRIQVGFQTFGSAALPAIAALVAEGEIGRLTGVGAVGTWVRTPGYWTRSAWTGRRTLAGRPVVDGVVTNPLAHAVATALHLAGAREADDVADVQLDQYRVNAVEVDDTSVVRVRTADGIPVTSALTLCAREQRPPQITVQGTEGTAVLDYFTDTVVVTGRQGSRTLRCGRTDLLADLLADRARPASALLSPLAGSGAFMRVLESVRTAPDARVVDGAHVEVAGDDATHLVLRGVEDWCHQAAARHATFAELGAPWASAPTQETRGDRRSVASSPTR